jgi:protein-tyrosine-phosphatase
MPFRDIEFVCTANRGRSPVAEVVARKIIEELELTDFVTINSSGTLVEITANKDFVNSMRPYVKKWIEYGLLQKNRLEILELEPQRVVREMGEIENKWRAEYLIERFGVNINHYPKQTIKREKAQLILVMDDFNLNKVKSAYAGNKYNPKIELLSSFAGSSISLIDRSYKDYKDYKALADDVVRLTRTAATKAVNGLIGE